MNDMLKHAAAASTVSSPVPTIATGGTVTYDGDYAIHSFTTEGTGSFEIFSVGSDSTFDVLVVGGGGAAGVSLSISGLGSTKAGGGGGGGVIYQVGRTIAPGSYEVIVGAGGTWDGYTTGSKLNSLPSTGSGENSSFDGLIALGGGGGATNYSESNPVPRYKGATGGSGGGGVGGAGGSTTACSTYDVSITSGSGVQPDQSGDSGTYGFGNEGGQSSNCQTRGGIPAYQHFMDGGGGGGAGGAASNTTGGVGKTVNITGTNQTFGAGGDASTTWADGTANTGNGGQGGNDVAPNVADGGSGIVIIRYKYQ